MKAIIYFMETNVNFNLREPNSTKPTNVNLVCRINGKQIKINIGKEYNIYSKHWDKKSQTALTNNSIEEIYIEHNTEINKRIAECRILFKEWKNYIAENTNQIHDSETLLRKYIAGDTNSLENNPIEWFQYYIESLSTTKISSKEQYIKDLKIFEDFTKEQKIKLDSFSQFTFDTLKQFEQYLISKDKKVSTINNKITTMIMLLNNASNYSLIDLSKNRINRYKKLENKTKNEVGIYLTEDEIKKIYELKLTDKKKVVRDIFIVQYYLGQRISDMSLETAIIKKDTIELIQKKTNQLVSIPLISPIVKEVLSEYNNHFPSSIVKDTGTLNKLIKEIAKEANINEICIYNEQIGTEVKTVRAEKWKLISTHIARHSFITNMLLKGHSKELIKRITGHKTDSAFDTYNNITSSNASKAILEKESKLKEIKQPEIINNQSQIENTNECFEWDSEEKIKEYLILKLKEENIFNTNRDTKEFIDTIVRFFIRYKDKYNSHIELYSDINLVVRNILKLDKNEDKSHKDTFNKITDEILFRHFKVNIIL